VLSTKHFTRRAPIPKPNPEPEPQFDQTFAQSRSNGYIRMRRGGDKSPPAAAPVPPKYRSKGRPRKYVPESKPSATLQPARSANGSSIRPPSRLELMSGGRPVLGRASN